MPKTAVYLNDYAMAAHNDVRSPRKFSLVEAKAKSKRMKDLANQNLRLSVLLGDTLHDSRAGGRNGWLNGLATMLSRTDLTRKRRLAFFANFCHNGSETRAW